MQVKDIFYKYPDADIELNISNYLDFFYQASQEERQVSINKEPPYYADMDCLFY